jgi:PAS domain S-box-containing protein
MTQIPQDDNSALTGDLHVQATYRLTEALVEAENQMQRRINLLSEIVFETDNDGRIVFLNNAWEKAIGPAVTNSLGHYLREYVFEEDWPLCEQAFNAASPVGTRPLIRMRRTDGAVKWMEMSIDQIAGGGAVGAIRDVTQQKLAQDELAKLSLVASYTDNMVIITDRAGQVEWVNQAFVRRTGYTLEDVVGRKPGIVLQGPDTDPNVVAQIGKALRDGSSCKAELLNYTRAGEPYWVQFHITPTRNAAGEIERFISIQTDSTELRRAQLALEAAKERAESANEAKNQFLATISHEMRTPLNAIIGSSDLALNREGGVPELREQVERINDGAETLLRLITDMLDVSKIEAGQIDLECIPMKIGSCLQGAITPLAGRAIAKGLDFRLVCDASLPSYMLGDPDRLRQIVSNLAENAVKFTERGFVRLKASRATLIESGKDVLEIHVVDSGVGIPSEMQARIFDRFTQGDSSTTGRRGGAGLGLNIVKSLVEAFGGAISVKSEPGNGSDFCVLLPLTAVPEPSEFLPEKPGKDITSPVDGSTHPARILVAEDNDTNYFVMQGYLESAGFTVERALNGREAVTASPHCDLILMDVEMPEMDGLEATRHIRMREAETGARPLPVLALTAHAVQQYKDSSLASGCTGYLAKPIRMQELLKAVYSALNNANGAPATPVETGPSAANR